MRAAFRLTAVLLAAFTACSRGTEVSGLDSVSFSAHAVVVPGPPPALRATLTATNLGGSTVSLEFGLCPTDPVLVRIYETPEGGAGLVWDAGVAYANAVCGAGLKSERLEPKQSSAFTATVPLQMILGDTIKSGEYAIEVEPTFLDVPKNPVSAGTVLLP